MVVQSSSRKWISIPLVSLRYVKKVGVQFYVGPRRMAERVVHHFFVRRHLPEGYQMNSSKYHLVLLLLLGILWLGMLLRRCSGDFELVWQFPRCWSLGWDPLVLLSRCQQSSILLDLKSFSIFNIWMHLHGRSLLITLIGECSQFPIWTGLICFLVSDLGWWGVMGYGLHME